MLNYLRGRQREMVSGRDGQGEGLLPDRREQNIGAKDLGVYVELTMDPFSSVLKGSKNILGPAASEQVVLIALKVRVKRVRLLGFNSMP